jgi:hypothetical protein
MHSGDFGTETNILSHVYHIIFIIVWTGITRSEIYNNYLHSMLALSSVIISNQHNRHGTCICVFRGKLKSECVFLDTFKIFVRK